MLKILLTGATGRIGTAILTELAQTDVQFALIGRNKAKLQQLIKHYGIKADIILADLAETDKLKNTVEHAAEAMGGLDVLINNAAVFGFKEFIKTEASIINSVIDVNIKAPLYLTQYCLPYLLQNPHSAVINISSIAGKEYIATAASYCASKFALFGFSGSLFDEVRAQGIKVCTIAPGQISLNGEYQENTIPPQDVAHAIKFVIDYPSKHSCPTEIIIRPQ